MESCKQAERPASRIAARALPPCFPGRGVTTYLKNGGAIERAVPIRGRRLRVASHPLARTCGGSPRTVVAGSASREIDHPGP